MIDKATSICIIIYILFWVLVCAVDDHRKNKNENEDIYKQAQIDCLNGNIKIELITNPDSSKVWKYKKDVEVK